MQELTIISRQKRGIAALDNFEEITPYLSHCLERYKGLVYSEENLSDAKADKSELAKQKGALEDRRKEIKAIYMAPYLKIEA